MGYDFLNCIIIFINQLHAIYALQRGDCTIKRCINNPFFWRFRYTIPKPIPFNWLVVVFSSNFNKFIRIEFKNSLNKMWENIQIFFLWTFLINLLQYFLIASIQQWQQFWIIRKIMFFIDKLDGPLLFSKI